MNKKNKIILGVLSVIIIVLVLKIGGKIVHAVSDCCKAESDEL